MENHNKGVILFSVLILAAITVSACQKPYSDIPLGTPTVNPTSLFVSPFPTSDNPMAMVEELSTGTAMAETAIALTAGTPLAEQPTTGTEITPDANVTVTVTATPNGPTQTPALSNITPSATQPLPTASTNRPASYALQKGEHPTCIARRFNVDPDELLSLSGLTREQAYSLSPGTVLTIPQTGNPFPGERALRSHPDTYTVSDASLTLYGVACTYGDIDPAAIAQANNLQLTATLTVGQQLTIP